MQYAGLINPELINPTQPDVVTKFDMTGGSSAQSADIPTGAKLIRLTGMTTSATPIMFFANLMSTLAQVPQAGTTSASSAYYGTTDSSGVSFPVNTQVLMPLNGRSTSFSVASLVVGSIMAEFWRR